MIPALAVIAVIALAAWGLVRLIEGRMVFVPPPYPEGFDISTDSVGAEEVWITARDGVKLNAWFWPCAASSKALLWLHGNAENIGHGLALLPTLARLNVNVLELDYRGYGRSEGKPTEAGIYCDADAAYDYLLRERGFQPTDIILYGHSLGGAVATDLASRRECGGLIIQSSLTSLPDMARHLFHVPLAGFAAKSRFDSIRKIKLVHAPILVAHGTGDETVPPSMGARIYAAAPDPKAFVRIEGAGHNDVLLAGGGVYLGQLKAFVERCGSRSVREEARHGDH